MIRRTALALFLCVSAAWAGDGSDDKTPTGPEPAEPLVPVRGARYRIAMKTGGSISGVVIGDHVFERRDGAGWAPAEKDVRGAGVRLFFVHGTDGFVFLPMKDVKATENLGDLDEKEGVGFAGQHVAAARRAEAERDRLRKARVARAEAAKAKAAEEAATAKAAEADKSKSSEDAMTPEERIARYTALLAKFPPDKWTPDTPKAIQRRVLLMDLFPDATEKEFLGVFDEWLKAYTAWKAGQDKAAAPAAGK